MSNKSQNYLKRTVFYGLASAVLYALVFSHTAALMPYFTAGSYLAALPIATAFLFSFIHGAFASNLWSMLGIEAVKVQPTAPARVATRVKPTKRQQQRPRLRLRA